MSNSQYKTAVAGVLISFLFAIGCTKIDTTKLGVDLLPTVDNIHTFDTTLNVIARNFDQLPYCDTLNRQDANVLGIISDDPYFGKTKADIFMEFKPAAYPVKITEYEPGGLIVDSAVVVLHYSYSFGDTNVAQKVQVYPLTDRFKVDSAYTTCSAFQYNQSILLGQQTYIPARLKDSITVSGQKIANQLRIPIDKFLVEGWLSNASTTLGSDSAFKATNRGFAIISDPSGGGNALNYFDLSNPNTKLSIYYRTQKGDKKDTTILHFPMTINSGEANYVQRDRNGSEITQHLGQPAEGNEEIFIQSSPGNFAELEIPGLSNLSNRVIHRAELIVEQKYSSSTYDDIFTVPEMLYLDSRDASGKIMPVPCDFTAETVEKQFRNMGGHAVKTKDANGNTVYKYTFNISRYLQNIVTKKSEILTLRLSAPYYMHNYKLYTDKCNQVIPVLHYGMNNLADGRIKLHGTDGSPSRMRLRIIYSKI